jgi:molybdenum cofactor cytidylyltransferase
MITTLLLAAGKSSRMGARDKLLEIVDGVPLLALLTTRALSVGPTFVTLPSADHLRRSALPPSAQIVVVDADLGMAHSIKAGIAALRDTATGVMILPADMPDITAADMATVQAAANLSSAPPHPKALRAIRFTSPRASFPALMTCTVTVALIA